MALFYNALDRMKAVNCARSVLGNRGGNRYYLGALPRSENFLNLFQLYIRMEKGKGKGIQEKKNKEADKKT